jgi:hypothetical protein
MVVEVNFFEGTPKLAGKMLLSLFLLLISTNTLADQGASRKPEDWEERLEMLRAVPYIAYCDTIVEEGETGVVLYDPERAYYGYNFYCTLATGEAFLLDMYGRPVHRWAHSLRGERNEDHAIMLENGDLVVINKFQGLLRFNWNSGLIWEKRLEAHHDVTQAPDGSLYVVLREHKEHRGLRVRFAAMMHLTEDGEEIDRWSSYDRLEELKSALDTRSFLDTVLDSVAAGKKEIPPSHHWDYFHMNTVGVLANTISGEKNSRFEQGNLLVCFRNVNQIAVLEKDTYRVLWAWGEGELQHPHHPTMLENGHILIFDNGVNRHYSRVVELDPVAEVIVWEYTADPPKDFYSFSKGSAQRLPNGNTLICESDRGRVFEVTLEGKVVWMWRNPAIERWVEGGRWESTFRMMRLPLTQVNELLKRWWWWD